MSAKEYIENLKISLVGYSGAILLCALRRSLRLSIQNRSLDWSGDSPKVLTFWHSQQLMMGWIFLDSKPASTRKPVYALISKSKDGRFIAKAMQALGIGSVAGSSNRGGREALSQMVRLIKKGFHITITPDGPKGPALKVKAGALKVAQLTGAEIIPSCFVAKNYWAFKSWDRMILPKPFSKSIILTGDPILVPREATETEVSELAIKLEYALNNLTTEANEILFRGTSPKDNVHLGR
jgi:lysophospholipid acyltransferase (LPLAT)-like uncharacterized protein